MYVILCMFHCAHIDIYLIRLCNESILLLMTQGGHNFYGCLQKDCLYHLYCIRLSGFIIKLLLETSMLSSR